ncbi:hypothetical protein I5P84_00285 [Pseudomonas mosselii]|uniref:hypothetical protein n=1 Tax=Pseudomonas mosselii TaxID=78327 RepID=UPI0018D83422|nr:hypothetical protein [Pseudomonas mosselii]MBH3307889.1 hypothetical protein [Pseudomonas mosselii]MBH3323031.1 hypothetical protein [Pseudomonas mosselii]
MSQSNQMAYVPHDLLEQALDAAAAVGMQDVADELDRILTPTGEQHQGESVALPARMPCGNITEPHHPWAPGVREGWNKCLDEIANLGPLYTHPAPSDPGELERLQCRTAPAALMQAMENLAVKALASNQPPFFPPASARQSPLVMLGGVCLRVSYSGLKWYHDQLIDDRWEPLSTDEFEALLTAALYGTTKGSNP